VDAWETIAERKILEAMEAGVFENLPGKGQPISMNGNPFEDPNLWMAHHLLRVNGFAPPWIEEACEIDKALSRLRTDLADARRRHAVNPPRWQRALDGFRKRSEEINQRILTYNLKSPSAQFHKLPFNLEKAVSELA